jgi:hypothetical protein
MNPSHASLRVGASLVGVTLALAGCGSSGSHGGSRAGEPASATANTGGIPPSLLAGQRRIDPAPRFHPLATGPVIGPCRPRLGARVESHVELFAANRVILIGAGIGTRPPRHDVGDRIAAACYGSLVTLDPTGVVLTAPGARLTLADLFRSWGQPLSATRIASFAGEGRVRAFINGRPTRTPVRRIGLTEHAEIVLEVGPYVPPHRSYTFPPA